tara:strand:- start:186535 stop:187815 length:1281 start_codon:yes stop_codon:yes gene_type:complete
MIDALQNWLALQGLAATQALVASRVIALVAVVLIAYLANLIAKNIILTVVHRVVSRTKTNWDDALVTNRVFTKLSHLAPAFVMRTLAPIALVGVDRLIVFVNRATDIYIVIIGVVVVDSLLNAIDDVYQQFEISNRIPIKNYVQVVKIIVIVSGLILAVSILLDKSPWFFLSGIGALTAVLLLVFKDTILGFVAGVQLVAHDMVRPGDWVEMPKYGADGDVFEITLNTVKIRNFDKTITTVPTYALISDSFKNWRGMSESEGRRIKRSVFIDINSIQFCSQEMAERFSQIQFLNEYVTHKLKELGDHNESQGVDESVLVNGRRMTNVGTFRAYLVQYLRRHPKIQQDMTFLVRQLAPTDKGLPIEIYVFSNDKRWEQYESIQADIFDHIYAVLPAFELRSFQAPSGSDILRGIAKVDTSRVTDLSN